jgi:hypothetical protein
MKTKEYTQGGIRLSLISLFLVLALCSTGIGIAGAEPVMSIIPSTASVDVGDNFSVFIEVDPAGYTLQKANTNLTFDSSKVSIMEVVNCGTFEFIFSPGTVGDGIIDDIAGADAGVSATGNLAEIRMHADNPGTFTIGLSNAEVGNATATLTPDINNGTFTIRLDDEAPVINSVTFNRTDVTDGDPILVTVNATDNFGVTSVTAEGVALTQLPGNIWAGVIIAVTGNDVVVNVSARDDADNIGWNNSTSYTARWIREDVYPDGEISITDIVRVGDHFGETGEPGWIPEDVYPDGWITITDIVRVGNRFGETKP